MIDNTLPPLQQKIINYLENSSSKTEIALLRHSLRHRIKSYEPADSIAAALTEEGRQLALDFGRALPLMREIALFYSSVPRCKETADLILKGFEERGGKGENYGSFDFLAGDFFLQPREILKAFSSMPHYLFFKSWAEGEFPASMISPLAESIMDFHQNMQENTRQGKLNIMISHDLIVAMALSPFCNPADPEFPWVECLSGLVLENCEVKKWKYFYP